MLFHCVDCLTHCPQWCKLTQSHLMCVVQCSLEVTLHVLCVAAGTAPIVPSICSHSTVRSNNTVCILQINFHLISHPVISHHLTVMHRISVCVFVCLFIIYTNLRLRGYRLVSHPVLSHHDINKRPRARRLFKLNTNHWTQSLNWTVQTDQQTALAECEEEWNIYRL